jgi:hypothetical protein
VAVRACHTVDSLPAFVAKFYKFSIGLIAILAVIMIMFGGLQWIFASGNMGKVSEAKTTITSAIAGLILALTSYVILYNINPKLVNLELPGGLTDVSRIEQSTNWCKDLGYSVKIREKGTTNYINVWQDSNNDQKMELVFPGLCSKEYEIENGNGQTCKGILCDSTEVCHDPGAGIIPFCRDIKGFCYELNSDSAKENDVNRGSDCDKLDDILVDQNKIYGCGKRFNSASVWAYVSLGALNAYKDYCQADVVFDCPSGYERVACESSSACSVTDKNGKILPKDCGLSDTGWVKFIQSFNVDNVFDWNKHAILCINSPARGVRNVNSMCCHKIGTDMQSPNNFKCVNNL